ncbi:unnamed protein product [Rotaria sordida]|uniref:Protein kinase domain-containing protein n=1 Tax=Rotaria sordida TaxID=392033 RepID=A0A814I0W9_9BILA|nr:unnamed protein product [Rotaria sordida]CAF1016664.1 unnamed protein product [Rotaria sordida]CAF1078968.1 unnamed protein product [Rotaria sordida]CAF1267166.1 unnamed protein product [Rotaria sordida]CAF3932269.1 unnamed protein product [Rotaria sordida]
MLILFVFFLIIYLLNINCLFNENNENILLDDIGNKIMNYVNENKIPLILKKKLIDNEGGSMSSTYDGYLNLDNKTNQSIIVKYSSFKTIWNYVQSIEIDRLYENGCYSQIDSNQNEYLVYKQDQNRIIYQNWIPSEVYVAFKGYICPNLMPTSTILNRKYSYISFFKSIQQNDDERKFVIIFKKLENGISLKKYLQLYSNQLTIDIVKYLIYSILIGIIKLKQMSIIHLDLNSGNIFIINNDNQHTIKFIDFSIMKFIDQSKQIQVMYSENLHQSFRNIFLNCPSCFHSNNYIQNIIFPHLFHQSFKNYSIEQLLNHPWFYTN